MVLFPKNKYFKIFLFFVLLGFTGILFLRYMTPEPPSEIVEQAGQLLSDAKKVQADVYAVAQYNESQRLYDLALSFWKVENERFIIFRDYKKVDSCFRQSIELSKSATNKALSNSKNIEVSAAASIRMLEKIAGKFDKIMVGLPLKSKTRQDFQRGRLLLSEANFDYKQNNFLDCKEKLNRSEKYLNQAKSDVMELLVSYFKSYPVWKKWFNETLAYGKGKHHSIIIDKMAKKCYVYKNSKLKYTFDIELGKNWIGNKRYQGDKATPEGIYLVTKKLDSKKTKYHKALLINYPNELDKDRFSEDIKNGSLPKSARIGGLIEIHGDGGKGVDWTDGCIALRNDDMDVIYKIADVDTKVTIVGSMVELNKIFNF